MSQTPRDQKCFASEEHHETGAKRTLKCCWEAKDGQIWRLSRVAAASREETNPNGLWRQGPQMALKIFGIMKMTLVMSLSVLALRKPETQKILNGSMDLLNDGLTIKDRKNPLMRCSRTTPFLRRFWTLKLRNPILIPKENGPRKGRTKPKKIPILLWGNNLMINWLPTALITGESWTTEDRGTVPSAALPSVWLKTNKRKTCVGIRLNEKVQDFAPWQLRS